MFVLDQTDSYKWPVSVKFPTDAGKFETQSFDATFARLKQSRIDEIRDGAVAGKIKAREIADEVMTGWEGVQDGDGAEVAYTPQTKARLLDTQIVASAIFTAWMDSLDGGKRKN